MLLMDASGKLFQLRILGYQFSGRAGSNRDSDRLMTEIIVDNLERRLMLQIPCLSRSELDRLASWFVSIHEDADTSASISFLEPCLSLQYVRQSLEAWLNVSVVSGQRRNRVSLHAGDLDFRSANAALRKAILFLPVR